MLIPSHEKDQLEELGRLENLQWFVEHSKLFSGQDFGELALLNDDKRKATIVTVTECRFATLARDDYKKILGKIESKRD